MSEGENTRQPLYQLDDKWLETLAARKSQPIVEDFELGTLEVTATVIDREVRLSVNFLQDNYAELQGLLPDGIYKWQVSLRRKTAT